MYSVLDHIKHYQQIIHDNGDDEQILLKCIGKLYSLGVTVAHLQATGVGRTVNALRKLPGEVGQAAKALVTKWKIMVAQEEDSEPEVAEEYHSPSEYQKDDGSDSNMDQRSNTSSRKESQNHDQGSDSDSSARKPSYAESNSNCTAVKRKLEDEKENYNSKRKANHSSQSSHSKRQKSESDSSIVSDRSRDKNNRQESSREYDDTETESEERSDSSNQRRQDIKTIKYEDSKQTPSVNHHKYENKEKSDYKHSSSTEHSKHKVDAHKERSSSKSKYPENHKSEKNRYSENTNQSKDRKKHREEKDSERDKSKHKEDSKRHSSSSQISSKDKEKHKERSSNEKHSSSKSKTKDGKPLVEKERHKQSYDKDTPSDSKGRSERSSHSHTKHSSDTRKDSSKSSASDNSDKKSGSSRDKSKDKSSRHSSSSKSCDRNITSSKESGSNNNKEKSEKSNKPKKSKAADGTIDSDEGIDCESGASFAEALGMITPVKAKKKIIKEVSSPPELKTSKQSAAKSSRTPSIKDELPAPIASLLAPPSSLAPLPPLEPLELSALPDISTAYRPRPPPKLLPSLDCENAMIAVMGNKNQRTKVYSGSKIHGEVPSLYKLCVYVLQEHIDALEYTGGVPYDILKPIVDKANPDQLFNLEHYNPYLIEDTSDLWKAHCMKRFRNKQRGEMESWREMYMRCLEEQEAKLKSLTANIRISQETKNAPTRQTKMAYVDTVVKPPRGIARKQAIHGTARVPVASPAARVAALATGNVVRAEQARPLALSVGRPTSNASFKVKKAPLMQKALQFMKGRKKR